jgi:hypothetical protein
MKRAVIAGAAGAAALGIVMVVVVVSRPSPDASTPAQISVQAEDAVPTPQYFVAHPDLFKEAEQKCHDGSAPSPLYCSNVHKAESLRLADQYRQGNKGGGATP